MEQDLSLNTTPELDPLAQIVEDEIADKPNWAYRRAMKLVIDNKRSLAQGKYMKLSIHWRDIGELVAIFQNHPNFYVEQRRYANDPYQYYVW